MDTSAAIVTGAAAGAKKNDLGGALIGGTVDSTGAVVLAGNALDPEGEQAAVLVKSIQNILIGFIHNPAACRNSRCTGE